MEIFSRCALKIVQVSCGARQLEMAGETLGSAALLLEQLTVAFRGRKWDLQRVIADGCPRYSCKTWKRLPEPRRDIARGVEEDHRGQGAERRTLENLWIQPTVDQPASGFKPRS